MIKAVLGTILKISPVLGHGWPLSSPLFILGLEVLNRDIRQDKKNVGLKIKKEVYKLRTFVEFNFQLILNIKLNKFCLGEIDVLMEKLREIAALAGIKINKIGKNMNMEEL